jgi:AhpD family alkylhydroperoxidase
MALCARRVGHDLFGCNSSPTLPLRRQVKHQEGTMYDMKNLAALKTIENAAAPGMQAFWAFDKAAFAPGAIDSKTKQLLALAVALTTQCPYCIAIHTKEARKAGASDAELSETAVVAAAMRAGAAITHATHMFQE